MKLAHVLIRLLVLVTSSTLLVDGQQHQEQLLYIEREGEGTHGWVRELSEPCILVIAHMQFEDHHEEIQIECELQGADRTTGKDPFVEVKNLPAGFLVDRDVQSSKTSLYAASATVDYDRGELYIPAMATVITVLLESHGAETRRELGKVGVRDVLVIRVVGPDSSTKTNEAQLSDDVFGNGRDQLNLNTQFAACSYNQLIFNKAATNPLIGTDGVYSVQIADTVKGAKNHDIRKAAVNQAMSDFGVASPQELAMHIMVCLPPGTTPTGWASYAIGDGYLTTFNDDYCNAVSPQMHEIGHNLGLHHAGDGGVYSYSEYEDQSGMMGFLYKNDDYPRMCFGGVDTYKLGWFSAYHVDLKPSKGALNWQGNLIGFAERDNASAEDKMIIRIESDISTQDIYVSFNRAIGFNSQTVENRNQVVVSVRHQGLGYQKSTRVGQLIAGNVHRFEKFENTNYDLIITIDSIDLLRVPARAKVTIQFGPTISRDGTAPVPKFVPLNEIEYKHSVLESEAEWEARVGLHDILDGSDGEIQAYFDHYGITIDSAHYMRLTGENMFNPDDAKVLNIPIDCTKRDNNFLILYSGVGNNEASSNKIKTKYCAWFVDNAQKFCPLVDLNPVRAVADPVTGEMVRPRIWQTCHQECDEYTHCSTKG